MPYPETQIDREQARDALLPEKVPPGQADLLRIQSRTILERRLARLLSQLTKPEAAIDAGRVRVMLSELSADIRSGSSAFRHNDCRWILERLTGIYAKGLDRHARKPFAITAAEYAQVIETISHACPGHDYSEAVGQLFCYMSSLFQTREKSWKTVYEHIRSIPDSVAAKQLLNRAFFVEIQELAEAGVENLFSIRKNLLEKIGKLATRIEQIDLRIATVSAAPNGKDRTNVALISTNVINLEEARGKARRKHLLASLKSWRQGLIDEKESEESIAALVDSDIYEFEQKLRNTRRAYFVRPL